MTPAEHVKAIEVTDAMIHAALKVQSPSLYRDALRKIGDGPRTTERIDADIKQAKAMIEAAIRSAVGAAPEEYDHGPQASSVQEAARDVGKWLNERPNRPLDLRSVAMLSHYVESQAVLHDSDCAQHNEPAYRNGPCDCSLSKSVPQGWQSIDSAPKKKTPMIVVMGVLASGYQTDPWCVWWQEDVWHRWPHKESPTHWAPLPAAPKP